MFVNYFLGDVLPEHTRWNATHDVALMVRIDPDPDYLAYAVEEAGYRVLVTDCDLARVFRVAEVSSDDVRTVLETDKNDLFFIEYDGEKFGIRAERPSNPNHFAGIIDVGEGIKDRVGKLRELNNEFNNKRVMAHVEGSVYEAMIVKYNGTTIDDDDIIDSCSGIDDLQEAVFYHTKNRPECIYSDQDFEEVGGAFVLKPEAQRH